MTADGRRTALYAQHVELGAKMVPFGGFVMPLQYSGQIAEHQAVRGGLGVFDLSHMGEFLIRGDGAAAAVDRLITNRVAGTEIGQVVYSPMCRPDGGIVDDLLAYHLADDEVMLVVNASNIDKDREWVVGHLPSEFAFSDVSEDTALIAVQGPDTEPFLSGLTDADLGAVRYYRAIPARVADHDVLLSRTGYTGEDGFELYVPANRAAALWERVLEAGAERGMVPVGLAARDTLRFEMGYCLYGNDIDDTTSPLEAGLGWTVKLDKDDFIGRDALVKQKGAGVARKLVGLDPGGETRSVPRAGYAIHAGGTAVGRVTSGTFSPSLGRGLAMGYVPAAQAGPGTEVAIDIRGKEAGARVVRPPFYTQGSRKA